MGDFLGNLYIYCVHALFATCQLELNLIAFANFVNQTGHVYEKFLLGGIVNNETETFGFIEEFYCSCVH